VSSRIFKIGIEMRSRRRSVAEVNIAVAAGRLGAFQPLHTDEDWVKENTPSTGHMGGWVAMVATVNRTGALGLGEQTSCRIVLPQMDAPTYDSDTRAQALSFKEHDWGAVVRTRASPVATATTIDHEQEAAPAGEQAMLVGGSSGSSLIRLCAPRTLFRTEVRILDD
jgi:hypothetical protein